MRPCFSGKACTFLFSSLTGKYHNISNATVKLLEALRGNGKHILGIERRNMELSKIKI